MTDFKGHVAKTTSFSPVSAGVAELPKPGEEDANARCAGRAYEQLAGVRKFTPPWEAAFCKGKQRPAGDSWRMDSTLDQRGASPPPLRRSRMKPV